MSFVVTIVGNTTADAEVRFTQGGLAVAGFTVAVNDRKFNRETNQWEDGDTTFVRCSAWREMAEQVAASLPKGTRVIVTGKVKMQEYETKDGTKGASLEMQVDEIGPSLRYATAQVQKVQRAAQPNPGTPMAMRQQTPAGYGPQAPAQQPWPSQQPQQQSWGQQGYNDEQPF